MKINIPFFYKGLPLVIQRDNLYLGRLYNNDSKMSERKVLCTRGIDEINDLLFEAPDYSINCQHGYMVNKLVFLGTFLEKLGYPSELRAKDIRKIYYEVLSSTKTIHKKCRLFGIVKIKERGKGNYSYWPYPNRPYAIDHEEFYKLEDLISLPTKPSTQEKQNNRYSFQKRLFFIP